VRLSLETICPAKRTILRLVFSLDQSSLSSSIHQWPERGPLGAWAEEARVSSEKLRSSLSCHRAVVFRACPKGSSVQRAAACHSDSTDCGFLHPSAKYLEISHSHPRAPAYLPR